MKPDSGIRSAGLSLVFLLVWTRARTDAANVSVNTGNDASLPCPCPPGSPPFLSWQKGEDMVTSLETDTEIYTENPAAGYKDRIELRWKGESCWLKILSVNKSDEGHYTCYYKTKPLRQEDIYLEVTDIYRRTGEDSDVPSSAVTSSVCVILILMFTAMAVFAGITCKKRQNHSKGSVIATSVRVF